MTVGGTISGFITIFVGVYLMPTVADKIVEATTGNITGVASNLLTLTTLFFSLSILIAAVVLGVEVMKDGGIV